MAAEQSEHGQGSALQRYEATSDIMPVAQIKQQIAAIQELMKAAMKDGEHYGVIPGCGSKPSLLKPGAEKLSHMFRIVPSYDIAKEDLGNGHREYRIVCTLHHAATGTPVGQGVGSCSTMESKYRYRSTSDYEVLDDPIPSDAKERKREYRKQGFGMQKVDGVWCWVKYTATAKEENPDIADTWNTVLKMAKKRAHVDAVLTATAASDIFTQDIEDYADRDVAAEPPPRAANPGRSRLQGTSPEVQQVVDEIRDGCELIGSAKGGSAVDVLRDLSAFQGKKDGKRHEIDGWDALAGCSEKWRNQVLHKVHESLEGLESEPAEEEPLPLEG